jgi:hypothetical protein
MLKQVQHDDHDEKEPEQDARIGTIAEHGAVGKRSPHRLSIAASLSKRRLSG